MTAVEILRRHVASYKHLSRHRLNCLDVCNEVDRLTAEVRELRAMLNRAGWDDEVIDKTVSGSPAPVEKGQKCPECGQDVGSGTSGCQMCSAENRREKADG